MINGNDGNKNGADVILSIVNAVIEPSTLTVFSWSGKSGIKGATKNRFDGYTQIIGLFYSVCRLADRKYAYTDCTKDLTYKVFKYAKMR